MTDELVLMPIKTKKSIKTQASSLFRSRWLTLTAWVNLLLTNMIHTKQLNISFDADEAVNLDDIELPHLEWMKNLTSFLDSIPW
jgi:antitoxin component of RelBE/YafQ-DinJ toxin-antitoxin module